MSTNPAHDLDSELAVLAAILQQPRVANVVALTLRPDDFHRPQHAMLYEAMLGHPRPRAGARRREPLGVRQLPR